MRRRVCLEKLFGRCSDCYSIDGIPFKCTDALDVAKNGTIYFTDASDKFPLKDYLLDMPEARPHGILKINQ